MNKSKRGNPSNLENGVDFISNMPDPILHLILQGLPHSEEVVRTSILSTRWRYLWTSIPYFPSLDLDVSRRPKNPKNSNKMKINEFISRVLANKTVDLESFRLSCSSYYNTSTVWQWIEAAVIHKVKRLDLKFCARDKDKYQSLMLPHFLVTCGSMESLRLFFYERHVRFPKYTGYSVIKVLELNSVGIYGANLAENFLINCPLLEEIRLIDCLYFTNGSVRISCPKPKSLIIHDNKYAASWINGLKVSCPELVLFECVSVSVISHFIFESVDSLRKAVILPGYIYFKHISFELVTCELFAGVSHVESLSLNLYILKAISAARDLDGNFRPSFPNLKTLEVTVTIDASSIDLLLLILKCCRNLESLHLIIQEKSFGLAYWELDKVKRARIMTHLKRVEFIEFNGEKQKLEIAHFLLENANALEEMVFSWCNQVRYHNMSAKIKNEVSKFRKASSTVKVITKRLS